jgi:hypothetical protein
MRKPQEKRLEFDEKTAAIKACNLRSNATAKIHSNSAA